MGDTVTFTSNGDRAEGYLAVPPSGSGPGLLVLQEWWGLVPQLTRVADRLAAAGFTALAPDLYRGEVAELTEMDKAAQLMTALPPDRAARDMAGGIDFLLAWVVTDFAVITGMSGAGRSTAANVLEDQGWFVIDNMPVALVPDMFELSQRPGHDLTHQVFGPVQRR